MIMFVFLLVVALTSVDAEFLNISSVWPKCLVAGALNPTNVTYGNACNDQFTNIDLGCKPSADCGYKYCCLNKTSTPNGNDLCPNSAGSGSCAIPLVNNFYTACNNNPVTATPISSYGCPCTFNGSIVPNACLPGYQCSIPPTTYSFAGIFPAAPALGYSGTGQYTVLPYNEAVCWTYPLSYYANSSSNYLSPFGGCSASGCGYNYKPVLPIFGVCSNTLDCQFSNASWNGAWPTGSTGQPPYKCNIQGTTTCQNKASCDPVNHICQSRQFNDQPGIQAQANPGTNNSLIWFFNVFNGGCSTC
jgi:hypothetical protein